MAKILLEARGIEKHYGLRALLDIEEVRIYEGDRIGLIGENGAGKSTLMAILSGSMKPDSGTVSARCPVAMIRQTGGSAADVSGQLRSEFRVESDREGLSGGEQTRRRIAGALSSGAPLLFADEPTTDLDAQGIERLIARLQAYPGAMLLISHDRHLLELLCNRVWHLEDGHIQSFAGGYADYQAELERQRAYQQFEYDQYRAEEARLKESIQRRQEWINKAHGTPKRMGNSEARLHKREDTDSLLYQSHGKQILQNKLSRLEVKERPRDLPEIRMALGASNPVGSRTALTVRKLFIRVEKRPLLTDAAFTLPTGTRTALLGENGCGKTTLLRALCGDESLASCIDVRGNIRFNPSAKPGWFDQSHERTLNFDASALDNAMRESALPESVARTVLARLNMRRDDVFKAVRVLSGGERAKVALARLLLSDCNVLILDEPTNHLDIFTLQALEALLGEYAGTLLFVSHDKAFTQAVATRLLTIKDARLTAFEGTIGDMEAAANADREKEALALEISTVQMRMAAVVSRMSAPKKGDDPLKLNAEYEALGEELRRLKQRL